ncbi:lariat debranching enzyme B-like [Limulus polyphemus]|uniref:Lariat debranching enzyme B-like n=1 Tax=Limulus polyphemus TaxID=6850 RepID=A0ABM1BMY4_LIMPO|nr:lariat debranching enzyme B-like [Limulus polyphemus]
MKIAVEGCAHGELDKIYETISYIEQQNGIKVDLLIICGDFQAVRNRSDLECMAVPPCYRKLNTFYKYYSGEKKAPLLTIFVGGNHEASNYLSELPYGGWVCPNIYYMGFAGVVNFGGLRIAGLSGIYKGADYLKVYVVFFRTSGIIFCSLNICLYEVSEKSGTSGTSTNITECVPQLTLSIKNQFGDLKEPIDIFISHDWPRGVYNYGNKERLLKVKRHFREEMEQNKLGSRPSEELLLKLQPRYWFAAHLHCRFAAIIPHESNDGGTKKFTKFLALDKCLPKRNFLQILDMGETIQPLEILYDKEWLSVLHSTNGLLGLTSASNYMPGPGCSERWDFSPTEQELHELDEKFQGQYKIPQNFCLTAPVHDHKSSRKKVPEPESYINPQTTQFCQKLGITDPLSAFLAKSPSANISIRDFSFVDESEGNVTNVSQPSFNPDEITLDEDESSSSDVDLSEEPSSVNPEDVAVDEDDMYRSSAMENESPDPKDEEMVFSSSSQLEEVNESLPSEKDVFFLDTKGSGLEETNRITSTPVSKTSKKNSPILTDFPEFKAELKRSVQSASDVSVTSNSTSIPVMKKMKRRNQAIYSGAEDDEDS